MSISAANPAGFSHPSPCLMERATKSYSTCNGGGELRPSYGVLSGPKVPAMAADFLRQHADEDFALGRVCRYVSRLCSGTASGLFHAPCGSSLFCFGCAALRVTVSLQILFGKNAEKISPEPP